MIKQLKHSEIAGLREQILSDQNGLCPICRQPIGIYCANLDHEHKKKIKGTGQIRGVLCRGCNVFLGKLENNCRRYGISRERLPRTLRRISKYLQEDHKPFIHPNEREKQPKLQVASYNKLKGKYDGKGKFPDYPKTGVLTIKLKRLFRVYGMRPRFFDNESSWKSAMKELEKRRKCFGCECRHSERDAARPPDGVLATHRKPNRHADNWPPGAGCDFARSFNYLGHGRYTDCTKRGHARRYAETSRPGGATARRPRPRRRGAAGGADAGRSAGLHGHSGPGTAHQRRDTDHRGWTAVIQELPMAKAGNAKGGFGAGAAKMGGPGKKPTPPKAPPKMGALPPPGLGASTQGGQPDPGTLGGGGGGGGA